MRGTIARSLPRTTREGLIRTRNGWQRGRRQELAGRRLRRWIGVDGERDRGAPPVMRLGLAVIEGGGGGEGILCRRQGGRLCGLVIQRGAKCLSGASWCSKRGRSAHFGGPWGVKQKVGEDAAESWIVGLGKGEECDQRLGWNAKCKCILVLSPLSLRFFMETAWAVEFFLGPA